MKNKAEEFRKRLREVGAYSKEETEFLKKVKNKSEQGKMNEKYTFIPTAKEFKENYEELKNKGADQKSAPLCKIKLLQFREKVG